MKSEEVAKTKEVAHELYNQLMMRTEKDAALLDITDVLLQVYQKLDQAKNPEVLINQLVNYIYVVGFDAKLTFSKEAEKALTQLSDVAKKAGLNSKYNANFTDKSQFYSFNEPVPKY